MVLWVISACFIEQYEETGYAAPGVFCDNFSEAGTENYLKGGASGSNGRLEAQLVIDSDNSRNTSVIGSATYILESLDVGGGESMGQADPLGLIGVTLGSGNWKMRLEGGSGSCTHQVEFSILAGKTLQLCLPLYCDDGS